MTGLTFRPSQFSTRGSTHHPPTRGAYRGGRGVGRDTNTSFNHYRGSSTHHSFNNRPPPIRGRHSPPIRGAIRGGMRGHGQHPRGTIHRGGPPMRGGRGMYSSIRGREAAVGSRLVVETSRGVKRRRFPLPYEQSPVREIPDDSPSPPSHNHAATLGSPVNGRRVNYGQPLRHAPRYEVSPDRTTAGEEVPTDPCDLYEAMKAAKAEGNMDTYYRYRDSFNSLGMDTRLILKQLRQRALSSGDEAIDLAELEEVDCVVDECDEDDEEAGDQNSEEITTTSGLANHGSYLRGGRGEVILNYDEEDEHENGRRPKRRKKSQDELSDVSTSPSNSPSCTSTVEQHPFSSATATPSRQSYYGEQGEGSVAGREDEEERNGMITIEEDEEDEEEAWISLQFVEDQPAAAARPTATTIVPASGPERGRPRFNTAFLLMLIDSVTKKTVSVQGREATRLYCESVMRPYLRHDTELPAHREPSPPSAKKRTAVSSLTKLALDSFVDVIIRRD